MSGLIFTKLWLHRRQKGHNKKPEVTSQKKPLTAIGSKTYEHIASVGFQEITLPERVRLDSFLQYLCGRKNGSRSQSILYMFSEHCYISDGQCPGHQYQNIRAEIQPVKIFWDKMETNNVHTYIKLLLLQKTFFCMLSKTLYFYKQEQAISSCCQCVSKIEVSCKF